MTTATQPWGVKGLTDSPRAPIVAKAKIGEKGAKGQPVRLDYIIFTEPQTGRRLPEYQAVFGDRPTHFDALLPADRVEDIVDVAWKRYGTKGLKCRGDGERGYDRETGEARECAGPYDHLNPNNHLCPHARPKGDKPPECKPVLSMRLVVPQIPGLGWVQLDTGGVASSIPTLVAQLRMIETMTGGHMAGIAVRVLIRAFPDRFGNAAYGWQLEPLRGEDANVLRTTAEPLVRVETQLPDALPPLEDPDADIYGIPEAQEGRQIEARADGPEALTEDALDVGLPGEVVTAELVLTQAMRKAGIPEAKQTATRALMKANRDRAMAEGNLDGYMDWLKKQTDRVRPHT